MIAGRVAIALALAACADERAAPTPAAQDSAPVGGPTTLPTPPLEEDVHVQLIAPGQEPRRVLRYQPRVGDEHVIVLESRMLMTMSSRGHLMFSQNNNTKGRISLRVQKVEGDRITLELTVIEMTTPSFDPTDFSKPPSLAGQRGTVTMTDRGKVIEMNMPSVEMNEDARDALQLADTLVTLPEEPVGLGARWEIQTLAQRNGMGLKTIDSHELVELGPTTARTRATLGQESWPQVVSWLARDPVSVFEVTKLTSAGAGEVKLAFAQAMPLLSTNAFEFTAEMGIRSPDGSQAITMTMKADMRATTEAHGRPAR